MPLNNRVQIPERRTFVSVGHDGGPLRRETDIGLLIQEFADHCLPFRTRDGSRAILTDIDPEDGITPVKGFIKLAVPDEDMVLLETEWFSSGAHGLTEHPWDLVSVETDR